MRSFTKTLLVMATISVLSACDDDDSNPSQTIEMTQEQSQQNIVDVAISDGRFTTLVAALEATELDDVLADDAANFTVFAPTDDAFSVLGQQTIAELLNDTEALSNILLYHVVSGEKLGSEQVVPLVGQEVTMANGEQVLISQAEDKIYLNLSAIQITDIAASNGIIHVIDTVLEPQQIMTTEANLNIVETALADERFTTLVTALTAADLVTTLADDSAKFTVFAPTNDAFAALGQGTINALINDTDKLGNVLLQHVIQGEVNFMQALKLNGQAATMINSSQQGIAIMNGMLTLGGANIIIKDIKTTNGIIHVIDTVIATADDLPPLSLIDVANNNAQFSTLLAAVEAAGLTSALSDLSQEFTLFAPTNEAFDALANELNVETAELLALPNLADILLFHVVGERLGSEQVMAMQGSKLNSLNNLELMLSETGEPLMIESANITAADINAANGLIHVIDKVLLPPQ